MQWINKYIHKLRINHFLRTFLIIRSDRNQTSAGNIPKTKIGGAVRYRKSEIDTMMTSKNTGK